MSALDELHLHQSFCSRRPTYCERCCQLRAAVAAKGTHEVTVHDEQGYPVQVPAHLVPAEPPEDRP